MKEDVPTNSVGGGDIAGVGVGPDGEPGFKRRKRKMKIKSFREFIKEDPDAVLGKAGFTHKRIQKMDTDAESTGDAVETYERGDVIITKVISGKGKTYTVNGKAYDRAEDAIASIE